MIRAKRIISKALIMITLIQVMGVNGRCVSADIFGETGIREEEKGFFEENPAEESRVYAEDETEEIGEKVTEEMTEDEDNNETGEEKERIYEGEEEDFDFNDELTSGGSIEIERYDIETGELSEECVRLLGEGNYNTLKRWERYTLTAELGLREDIMEKCAEKGLSVRESYVYVVIAQQLDVSLLDAV